MAEETDALERGEARAEGSYALQCPNAAYAHERQGWLNDGDFLRETDRKRTSKECVAVRCDIRQDPTVAVQGATRGMKGLPMNVKPIPARGPVG